MKARCTECGRTYEFELQPGERLDEYECKCGGSLRRIGGSLSDKITKNRNLQIAGICCISFILIVLAGFSSPEYDPTEIKEKAIEVSAAELYSNSIKEGTPVRIRAYVIDSQDGTMRICQTTRDEFGETLDYDRDIMVEGDFQAFYENEEVIVWGIFRGPSSYVTVLGSERTVPLIDNAIVERTGNRYHM